MLEKFRRYLQEVSAFDSEQSLLETIRGEFVGNDKTRFGTAYHDLIEGNFTIQNGLYKSGDFLLNEKQARPGIDYKQQHPLMIHESTHTKVYQTKFFPIQVIGHTDGIEGAQIRDIKMKFREHKVTEYMDSLQWRFYLDMVDLNEFFYDIFEVKGFEELPHNAPFQNTNWEVIPQEPIHCLRYEHMQDDLTSHLNLFLDYLYTNNLFKHLKPAIEEQLFA